MTKLFAEVPSIPTQRIPTRRTGIEPSSSGEGARVIRSALHALIGLARRMGFDDTQLALDLALAGIDADLDRQRRHARIAAE